MRVAIVPENFMECLRNGLTPAEITSGRRPSGVRVRGMSSIRAFKAHCKADPEWGLEATELSEKNNKAALQRRHAGKRSQTHCKRGHPLVGDNLYIPPGDEIHRVCKACTRMRAENPPAPNAEQIIRVTEAIKSGQPATQFCGSKSPDRVFGFNKLKLLRRIDADFEKLYNSRVFIVRRHAPRHDDGPPRSVLNPEANDYYQVASLVPRYLPPDIRDDVVQSIFLAILEGALQRDQVKDRVKDYIRAHYREANRHGVGKYGMVSLDAPLRADSDLRLIDRITHNNWDGIPG
jgi:hypothetical protein